MKDPVTIAAPHSQEALLSTNKVIRNTYMLLSMTLLFSAVTAGISMALNLPHPGLLLTLGGFFGLLFLTSKFKDSATGLAFVFALTGFMGYTLGPILNAYLALPNGSQIVMSAMGLTGAIFLGLSGYALIVLPWFSGHF
jgi:modulator of FtsH protease